MSEMLDMLAYYLTFDFVRYALIVAVLIALCSSLLGVTLVLRRFSLVGDGLSHVAFGAMAVAAVVGISGSEMPVTLVVTAVCAVILLRGGTQKRVAGDAAIAMMSVGALAIGYLLMNIFSTSSNLSADVCGTLFGSTSILTLTDAEVLLSGVLSVICIVVFVVLYDRLFAVTFDEPFARATGTRASAVNLAVAIATAVIIVLAMKVVGALLVTAFLVFPALSAMRLATSFRAVTVTSAVLSVVCALAGILTSILAGTPVGATIVVVDMCMFFLCWLASLAVRGR